MLNSTLVSFIVYDSISTGGICPQRYLLGGRRGGFLFLGVCIEHAFGIHGATQSCEYMHLNVQFLPVIVSAVI